MKRIPHLCLSVMLAGLIIGCGSKKGPQPPPLAQIKGTVTLDGKPMGGGEVRFNIPGHGPISLEIKNGAFAGEVYSGKAKVGVVWDKDGPPNPMDPKTKLKVNAVADQFSGPNSPFNVEIKLSGNPDMKLAVTSAAK